MTKAVGRIAPFKYLNPSQAWFYAFLNRWPDLKNFLFGPRSNRKSKGVSGDSIQSYFEQLEKVCLNIFKSQVIVLLLSTIQCCSALDTLPVVHLFVNRH